MSVRSIYISKYILLFAVSLFLSSCTVSYNSIRYTKNDGAILEKAEKKADKKKFRDNTVFVHFESEILQLKDVEYKTSTTDENSLTGETTMVDHHYEQTYYVLRNHKRDRMNELEVAGPKCAYFKQTHIFADSAIFQGGKIQIKEKDVNKINMYYRARMLMYILIIAGTAGFIFLYFLITLINENLYFP